MKSLIQFFEESVEMFSNNVYLWEKPNDKYEGTTYGETRKHIYEFAAGLLKLGIKKGDRIEIRGFGSLSIREYKSYKGRNPKTGANVDVQPKKLPYFKVGKELKEMVNTGEA